MSDNDKAKTHLSRLGVNPIVSARLEQMADNDGMPLREFVVFVLGDYRPPSDVWPPQRDKLSPNQCVTDNGVVFDTASMTFAGSGAVTS